MIKLKTIYEYIAILLKPTLKQVSKGDFLNVIRRFRQSGRRALWRWSFAPDRRELLLAFAKSSVWSDLGKPTLRPVRRIGSQQTTKLEDKERRNVIAAAAAKSRHRNRGKVEDRFFRVRFSAVERDGWKSRKRVKWRIKTKQTCVTSEACVLTRLFFCFMCIYVHTYIFNIFIWTFTLIYHIMYAFVSITGLIWHKNNHTKGLLQPYECICIVWQWKICKSKEKNNGQILLRVCAKFSLF